MARQASAEASQIARRMTAGGWLRVAVIGCAALALALALLAHTLTPAPNRSRALIGHAAPPFVANATQSGRLLAQPVRFAGQAAHPTLLVFFDTLCVHCVVGIQIAQAVAQAPGQPAINIIYLDSPGENAEITGRYMARLRFDPPVLLDHGAHIASDYGVAYYPSFILVDTHGVIRSVWTGAPTASDIRAAMASAQ